MPASQPFEATADPLPIRAALHVTGLVKRYRAGEVSCTALDGVVLRVRAGDCVLIAGDARRGRIGPRTLLWCVAGIVRPTAGAIGWLADGSGDSCAAPAMQLVTLEARLPERWRACDVLQAAVPPGTQQSDADRLVTEACHDCELDAGQLVQTMSPPTRWQLQLARAVASNATWLLLDMPGTRSADSGGLSRPRAALQGVVRRARERGGAVILAADGDGPLDDALPRERRFVLGGGLLRADGDHDRRRVAEPVVEDRSVDLLAGPS